MKKRSIKKSLIAGAAVFVTTACAFLLNSDQIFAKNKTDVEIEIEEGDVNTTQGTAEVTVSVKNDGDDFGGYVRLLISEDRSGYNSWKGNAVAYDTYISVAMQPSAYSSWTKRVTCFLITNKERSLMKAHGITVS